MRILKSLLLGFQIPLFLMLLILLMIGRSWRRGNKQGDVLPPARCCGGEGVQPSCRPTFLPSYCAAGCCGREGVLPTYSPTFLLSYRPAGCCGREGVLPPTSPHLVGRMVTGQFKKCFTFHADQPKGMWEVSVSRASSKDGPGFTPSSWAGHGWSKNAFTFRAISQKMACHIPKR